MDDTSLVKIIQSLDLDYSKAILSTKHFEQAIQSLNQQLTGMKGIAMQAAKEINSAFAQQLGSVPGNKTIVDQYGKPLATVKTEAAKAATAISSSMGTATKAAQQHGQAVQDVAKQYNVFGSEMQRRAGWFLSGSIWYGGIKAAKEAVSTISEVEMGMTEIARVMEDSTFVFKDYRDELMQLGVEYGFVFETVQDIALRWAQAGYNVADSLKLTRTSLLALNTAELDATNATESMVGIMAQWNLQAEDLSLVIDKINKTADDYTVTSQDLVDGLLRSSGAARIMNLSLDETISLLTVMREASGRTGREVGNALNSILSYIQRPGSIETLEKMGIQVFADEAKTQFRNVLEIFRDIEANWQTASASIQDGFVKAADDAGLFNEELAVALGLQEQWNDLQQRDIAQAAAGVYRRNYFIGMIERLSTAQEVLNNMMDAAGYSMRENDRTMDTLAKKYESLKASMQMLAVALGDAGLLNILKGLTDAATSAANSISKLDPELKALLTTALELLAATQGIKAVGNLFGVDATLGAVVAALPGWTKLIPIILSAASAIALYVHNAKQAADESLINSSKQVASKLQETQTVDKLIDRYEELRTKVDLTSDEQGELKSIIAELTEIYPHLTAAIEDTTGALDYQIDAIKRLNATQRESLMVETRINIAKTEAELKKYGDDLQKISELVTDTIDYANRLDELSKFPQTNLSSNLSSFYEQNKDLFEVPEREPMLTASEFYEKYSDLIGQATTEKIFETRTREALDQIIIYYSEQAKEILQKRGELEANFELLKKLQSGDYDFTGDADSGSGVSGTGGVGKVGGVSTGLFDPSNLRALLNANKISLQTYYDNLLKIRKEQYSEFIDKSYKELNAMLSDTTKADKVKAFLSLEQERIQTKERLDNEAKKLKESPNEALQEELKIMEHRKRIGKLTVEDEIAQLKRLQATYTMNADERMNIIERIYDAEQALLKEREKAEEELQKKIEKLQKDWTDYYKDQLKEQKDAIKDAYDERIKKIDETTKLEKKAHEDRIKQIDDELKKLDRDEETRDYNKKMQDLHEELAYWSVRTSEEARKKVADLTEQIAEEEHDREFDLKKQGLEDEKETLKDKINAIEDAAKKEKEKWEATYKDIEAAFDDHALDIIATAGAMAEGAYDQWVKKYFNPLMRSLASGTAGGASVSALLGQISAENSEIYQLASSIVDFKQQYEQEGNTFAHQQAKLYYQKLSDISPSVADTLQKMNYLQAKEYLNSLPRMHSGGLTLSYGAVYMKPGELVFPPDLSTKMDALLSFLKATPVQNMQTSNADNRREVNLNGPLVNIEKNYNEDETDSVILARSLHREFLKLV